MNLKDTGALFRAPGGQNEHPEAWGSVIRWGALNVGAEANRDPDWLRQRKLMRESNTAHFPWVHVHNLEDLDRLLAIADKWHLTGGARVAGVNIEDVVTDKLNLAHVAERLDRWGGQVIIPTLAWLQNGQGWHYLAAHHFALEYFVTDPDWNPKFNNKQELIDHAFAEIGPAAKVTFLYDTRPEGGPSSLYDMSIAHSFYTADDVGTSISQWRQWDYDGEVHLAMPTAKPPKPKPNPYAKDCVQTPRAANHSGPRRASSIRLIVIHSAESRSASGVAAFFSRASTRASTQLAVDDKVCHRMLSDLTIPWGASGANSDGLHVEICGYAKWSEREWLAHEAMLRRAAYKCAVWSWQYDIPRVWLSTKALGSGTTPGFTTHKQVNDTFKNGTHWDPGPNFPKKQFIAWVREYFNEVKAERSKR